MTEEMKQSNDQAGLDENDVEGLFRLLGRQTDPDVPVSDQEADLLVRLGRQLQPSEDEVARRVERLLARRNAERATEGNLEVTPWDTPAQHPVRPMAVPSTPPGGEITASARSFLRILEDQTELDPSELSARLGSDVTPGLLLATARYPHLFPVRVRKEFASRAARQFGVSPAESLGAFEFSPALERRAASRGRAYGTPPQTFSELLLRCGLKPEDQRFWSGLVGEE